MPTPGQFEREFVALGSQEANAVQVSVFLTVRLNSKGEAGVLRSAHLARVPRAGGTAGIRGQADTNGMHRGSSNAALPKRTTSTSGATRPAAAQIHTRGRCGNRHARERAQIRVAHPIDTTAFLKKKPEAKATFNVGAHLIRRKQVDAEPTVRAATGLTRIARASRWSERGIARSHGPHVQGVDTRLPCRALATVRPIADEDAIR